MNGCLGLLMTNKVSVIIKINNGSVHAIDQTFVNGMEKQERTPVTINIEIDSVIFDTINSMSATRAAELKMFIHLAA